MTDDSKPKLDVGTWIPGVSLRDYFAGQAIVAIVTAGMTSNELAAAMNHIAGIKKMTSAETFAFMAYQTADAMIKARGQ